MIDSPLIFANQKLTENLNLRFSLDMERWLTPCITDQNLTENFKFKLQPGHGKMIDPQQYCQPVTQCEFEI